jgi:hypothetical protein
MGFGSYLGNCKMNATLRTHPLIHSQPLLQTKCVGKRLRRFAGAMAFIFVQPCVALTLTVNLRCIER